MKASSEIKVPAIQVEQSPGRFIYTFALDGKLIPSFTTISRIRRNGDAVEGYQRPEVLSHIGEIKNYIESQTPMLPNAIVVAFDQRVRFEPARAKSEVGYARPGTLLIPVDVDLPDDKKPGFVVDGQQRLAAIRDAEVPAFPICVTAFIAEDIRQQTEQFILVNSTKPLPKGLIYELLPNTEATLPTLLQRRRFPAHLLERLNRDADSPLHGKIQTPTTPEGVIKDNSVLKMLENSLSDGALYRFRGTSTSDPDTDSMLRLLTNFWSAVRTVFNDSWGQPPRRSRLMHGTGVAGLGFLMDAIAERHRQKGIPSAKMFTEDLAPLKEHCRWTDGYWEFGPGCQRKWNEIQNTSKDTQLLANYLLVQYKSLVWNAPGADRRRQRPLAI